MGVSSEKRADKYKYIGVFAITTLIFILGMILGNYLSSKKLSQIENFENQLKTDTATLEIQYLLLAEEPCKSINYSAITEELYSIGNRLDFMESSLGKDNEQVIMLKQYYSLLEIRQWLLMKKAKKECGLNETLILYFYSNAGDCNSCEEQGFVLDYIKKNHENVKVYSFDINLNNAAVNTLKGIYHVQKAPTLVINDNTFTGFKNAEQVEEKINI